jgi:hypothetical protein
MMDDRVAVLEAENEALQVEISRRASCAPQEYLRYGTSASGIRLPFGKTSCLTALERKLEGLSPSIMKAIEERLQRMLKGEGKM